MSRPLLHPALPLALAALLLGACRPAPPQAASPRPLTGGAPEFFSLPLPEGQQGGLIQGALTPPPGPARGVVLRAGTHTLAPATLEPDGRWVVELPGVPAEALGPLNDWPALKGCALTLSRTVPEAARGAEAVLSGAEPPHPKLGPGPGQPSLRLVYAQEHTVLRRQARCRGSGPEARTVGMEVSLEPGWTLIQDHTAGGVRTLQSVPLSTPQPLRSAP